MKLNRELLLKRTGVLNKKITELDQKILPVNDQSTISKKNNIIYKKCRNYVKKVHKLKNQIKNIKLKHMLNTLNDNEAIQGLIKHLIPSLALLLQGELKSAKRKYVARRWDTDQKNIALRLYAICFNIKRNTNISSNNVVVQGLLPGEATVTANLVSNMDKLFDCLNSDSADRKKGKPHCTNMTDNSPHLDHLKKIYGFFENCTFVGCYSSPPSKEGWIWTIQGVLRLYNNLKIKHKTKALCTRRLQQDSLENLFGTIRGNCGSNYNPTSGQFVAGLKTAILSNLAHLRSNCIKDDCSSMSDYKDFLTTTCPPGTCIVSESTLVTNMISFVESSFQESVSDAQGLQACAYVCGFLLESLGNKCKLYN